MIDYALEYLFSFEATLAPPEVIGVVPEGIRSNWYFTGGEVDGPKLRGKLRPVGADALTIRPDGVGVVDVRTTIETCDGALVSLTYSGVVDLGEDGYQRWLRKERLPSSLPLRTTLRFSTAHPDYLWLNPLRCVGIGETLIRQSKVVYDVYALR